MKKSCRFFLCLPFLFSLPGLDAQSSPSILGSWSYKDGDLDIVTEFRADGTFFERILSRGVEDEYESRYILRGKVLQLDIDGDIVAISLAFRGADEMTLTYEDGTVIVARRVKGSKATSPPAATAGAKPAAAPPAPASKTASGRPARVMLKRVWEPNEKAFTVLVPHGWKVEGGILNVSPSRTGGPGNSITPKCDFIVKSDDRGTVMIRWVPTWNYADLSYSPSGFGLNPPDSWYQGMQVRLVSSPRQFLMDLLRSERPRASGFKVVAEDPLEEVTAAFEKQAEGVNASLRQMGIAPMRIESLAMVAEYVEDGTRYRETLMTTIADNRAGAFQWSNENTIVFRAPADRYDSWKSILDMIQTSRQANPEWLASVARNAGARAKSALETQAYINKVGVEIAEARGRAAAESRHEQWLFISGQEEYKNPFTGQIERGTSAYRYRWENGKGDVLYVDENSFDPNRFEEYNSIPWKRSEVWDRKK